MIERAAASVHIESMTCSGLRMAGAIIVMVLSCMHPEQAQQPSQTGTEGVISVSPSHPGPTREGIANSAPLANVSFEVANDKQVISSFTTDQQGRFRISLGPGHYIIRQKDRTIRRCGPFEVDVAAGKMTSVQWQCDSGMR